MGKSTTLHFELKGSEELKSLAEVLDKVIKKYDPEINSPNKIELNLGKCISMLENGTYKGQYSLSIKINSSSSLLLPIGEAKHWK